MTFGGSFVLFLEVFSKQEVVVWEIGFVSLKHCLSALDVGIRDEVGGLMKEFRRRELSMAYAAWPIGSC